MREEMHETLRSKETTIEGRHLHQPDGFPHMMVGVLVFFVMAFPIAIGVFYVTSGVVGAVVSGLLLLFVGVPMATTMMKRGADAQRAAEEREEHAVEAAEASHASGHHHVPRAHVAH
jgi:hypothetical protein